MFQENKIEGLKILKCRRCQKIKEGIHLKSYNLKICLDCFLDFFRKRVKETIERFKMFSPKDKVAVAISGGKDSMALAKVLKDLGYNITLFHINCQIKENDYSEKSQKAVEEFAKIENLPLKILDFKDEIGIDVKLAAKISRKEICAVCGMIKRYLLNREAKDFDVIVTGHTLNDEAASLLKSLIFWQEGFIRRQFPVLREEESLKKKAKPLTLCFERETKLFCDILKLPYLKESCPLRGGSYVIFKKIIEELEKEMPSSVLNFYKGFLKRKRIFGKEKPEELSPCKKCGYLTVAEICNFCKLKEKIKALKQK
jgi:tRNA(Ile)-lysidine synthase TilS/MesJ